MTTVLLVPRMEDRSTNYENDSAAAVGSSDSQSKCQEGQYLKSSMRTGGVARTCERLPVGGWRMTAFCVVLFFASFGVLNGILVTTNLTTSFPTQMVVRKGIRGEMNEEYSQTPMHLVVVDNSSFAADSPPTRNTNGFGTNLSQDVVGAREKQQPTAAPLSCRRHCRSRPNAIYFNRAGPAGLM